MLATWAFFVARAVVNRRLKNSTPAIPWWAPATVGVAVTLAGMYIVFPHILDRYTHIADIVTTAGAIFVGVVGLSLAAITNKLIGWVRRRAHFVEPDPVSRRRPSTGHSTYRIPA